MRVILFICLCLSHFSFSQTVDAGNAHALVLDDDSVLWSMGRNDHGQLGIGSYDNMDIPVETGLNQIQVISRGYDHSMAIDKKGDLWVWGNNRFGQLGVDNGKLDILSPIKLKTDLKFAGCEGGYDHSIFLDNGGRVWASGFNENGELGNLGSRQRSQLVKVKTAGNKHLSNIQSIVSVGSHAMALDSNGFVHAWGANYYGELGHFDSKIQNFSKQIVGLENIESIAVGWGHSVALDENGDVYVWGARPSTYPMVGSGARTQCYENITKKEGLGKIVKIACGSWHVMTIDEVGDVWSWGWNNYGMLGNGSVKGSSSPIKMDLSCGASSIGGGCFQSIVVDSVGNIYSCGDNNFGQLGLSNHIRQTLPQMMLADFGKHDEVDKLAIQNIAITLLSILLLLVLIVTIALIYNRKRSISQ